MTQRTNCRVNKLLSITMQLGYPQFPSNLTRLTIVTIVAQNGENSVYEVIANWQSKEERLHNKKVVLFYAIGVDGRAKSLPQQHLQNSMAYSTFTKKSVKLGGGGASSAEEDERVQSRGEGVAATTTSRHVIMSS